MSYVYTCEGEDDDDEVVDDHDNVDVDVDKRLMRLGRMAILCGMGG